MAIRPVDIRRKEFKSGFRGYDANQVDDFLDEVADEFQAPWSRQAPVVPIGCHVYILSRPPDRPRSEGRC